MESSPLIPLPIVITAGAGIPGSCFLTCVFLGLSIMAQVFFFVVTLGIIVVGLYSLRWEEPTSPEPTITYISLEVKSSQ